MTPKHIGHTFRVFAFLLIAGFSLFAQSTGNVTGILKDPTGKTVPGAVVKLRNKGTQQQFSAATGDSGSFTFTFLTPGAYDLQAESVGFRRIFRDNIVVNVAGTVTVDATFELGETTQQINVTTEVAQVASTTSSLGGVVEERMITSVPLSSRNFTQILALSPGVTSAVPDAGALGRNSVNISANGSRPFENTMILNGLLAENPMSQGFDDDIDKTGVPIPAPDSLQEFKVQTGLYDAEFGRQGGAVINVVTRSGTNGFHGTLYEFLRNDKLNANEFFRNRNAQPRGVLKQNQFGGGIGGAIIKDKLFFFASYQGTRQVNGVSTYSTRSSFLPALTNDRSRAALGAIFGGRSGAQGGVAVARDGSNINPVALNILTAKLQDGSYLIPTPQSVLPNGSGFSTFALAAKFNENQLIGNGDYMLSPKHRIAVKTFYSKFPTVLPFAATPTVPGFGENDDKSNINLSLVVTSTISPTVLNEARVGYTRLYMQQIPVEPLKAADIGIRAPVDGWPGIPLIAVTGAFNIGPEQNDDQVTMIHNWLASDTLSIMKGRHQIRVGGDVNMNQVNRTNAFLTRGRINFASFTDFLLGMSGAQNGTAFSNLSATQVANGIIRAYPRFKNWSLFVQDDYRVNSRLTINAGLRYQFNGNKTDKRGRIGSFDRNLALGTAPPPEGTYAGMTVVANCGCTPPAGFTKLKTDAIVYNENYLGFAPRIGLAFRPIASKDNFVFRAGYGIFWSSVAGTVAEQANFDPFYQWLSAGGADVSSATFENPFTTLPPPASAFPLYLRYTLNNTRSIFSLDPHMTQPYTQQWTANFQFSAKSILFETGYVGSSSVHLIAFMNPNQPLLASPANPVNGLTTNTVANRALRVPILGWLPQGIRELQSDLNGNYHSLQISAKRRLANGLSFMTAYTWSHAIDNNNAGSGGRNQPLGGYTGDYYNRRGTRGTSSFDRTHRVVASYSYDVPRPKTGSGLVNSIIRDWGLSGVTTLQSGLPFSITDSNSGTIYGISAFAQFAAGKTAADAVKSGSPQSRLDTYFNTTAFGPAPQVGDGTGFGNVGRSLLRGPGNVNFDTSITRSFAVGGLSDTGRLEFRSEFFNLLNHTQFNNPGGNRGAAATFGVISSTVVSPRIMQFALKYAF